MRDGYHAVCIYFPIEEYERLEKFRADYMNAGGIILSRSTAIRKLVAQAISMFGDSWTVGSASMRGNPHLRSPRPSRSQGPSANVQEPPNGQDPDDYPRADRGVRVSRKTAGDDRGSKAEVGYPRKPRRARLSGS